MIDAFKELDMAPHPNWKGVEVETFSVKEGTEGNLFLMTRGKNSHPRLDGEYISLDLKAGTTEAEAQALAEHLAKHVNGIQLF